MERPNKTHVGVVSIVISLALVMGALNLSAPVWALRYQTDQDSVMERFPAVENLVGTKAVHEYDKTFGKRRMVILAYHVNPITGMLMMDWSITLGWYDSYEGMYRDYGKWMDGLKERVGKELTVGVCRKDPEGQ